MRKLIECLLKSIGQIQFVKVPQCFFWNQGLFDILGGIFFPIPTPSSPATATSLTQVKNLWTKQKITFDLRLPNVTDPVGRGFIAPPLKI